MYNSGAFSKFTVLYNHHHCLIPEHFYYPPKKPWTHEAVTPHSLLPQLLATANLFCPCGSGQVPAPPPHPMSSTSPLAKTMRNEGQKMTQAFLRYQNVFSKMVNCSQNRFNILFSFIWFPNSMTLPWTWTLDQQVKCTHGQLRVFKFVPAYVHVCYCTNVFC